jgi:hypothetical protein
MAILAAGLGMVPSPEEGFCDCLMEGEKGMKVHSCWGMEREEMD